MLKKWEKVEDKTGSINLSKKEISKNQGDENVKRLRDKKRIQRPPATGIKKVRELSLQSNARESQDKPKCLNTFQAIFHSADCPSAKDKRKK